MVFSEQNEKLRNYYKKDFSQINELLSRIRNSLTTGEELSLEGLRLDDVIEFEGEKQFFYISLFQENTTKIRFGSRRKTLSEALNRIILKLRENPRFSEFETSNPQKVRILFEFATDKKPLDIKKVHTSGAFDETRFEPGITGIEVSYKGKNAVFMPTDCPVLNEMSLPPVLEYLYDKLGISNDKKLKQSEKIAKLKNLEGAEFFIFNSYAFVTFENTIVPLYRGNLLYKEFDYKTVIDMFVNSCDWLIANMDENGKFMYYYNPTNDDNIDHEHPKRRPPDLYYNDLRHGGGIIALLRCYELTKDEKYLKMAKKGVDWTVNITKFHQDPSGREAAYVYANQKAKLGGVGIPLIAFMRYRNLANDNSYDRYIEAFARHLISRITPEGEFLGYYIHPSYHNGEPLLTMTDKERNETFSFYYPGEALMGLGIVANDYDKNDELVKEIVSKSKIAMRWIIDKRPLLYKEHFTALPSDAWLMQAIEEWSKCDGFLEKNDINFVFNDAKTMMEKMYKKDNSPYIDFEGGMYYNYGDHYYPDGARCEGLIAAYYLAKNLKEDELAEKILASAKKAAKCQFQLYNSKYNNFAHKNPKKSQNSIKFKATRQWVRVDSIQHVACFFIRLYWAENKTCELNFFG